VGAAPTGTASEAEYVEIGLTRAVDPAALITALDAALPAGLDILDAAVAEGASLPDRIDASSWVVELPGIEPAALQEALRALLARESVVVERVTPAGRRQIDVRAALVRAEVTGRDAPSASSPPMGAAPAPVCAIMTAVVRQTTPAVRPDDVLGALDVVAGLRLSAPPKATRMAQGLLDHRGDLADPLGSDRVTTRA
jgi:radical SAM-linked protein